MGDDSTTTQATQAASLFAGEAWFDPIEAGIRERIRGFIEALFEEELTAALGRGRCERAVGAPTGHRNGTRERQLLGSFGPVQVSMPRARMADADGGTTAVVVPAMATAMLAAPDFGAHDLSSLRMLSYGAAPMP